MATQNPGFVEVAGHIEPSAIAGAISADAYDRLGQVVILTCDWLEEQNNELTQNQKCALATNALRLFDGFEAQILDVVLEAIRSTP